MPFAVCVEFDQLVETHHYMQIDPLWDARIAAQDDPKVLVSSDRIFDRHTDGICEKRGEQQYDTCRESN